MGMTQSPDNLRLRDLRQRDLVPPERLAACHAVVIGVGAIGHQVALQLAALGVPRLTLFDDDRVSVENLAPQGYWPEHLGGCKVMATQHVCLRINPRIQVTPIPERFKRSSARSLNRSDQVVFSCVDSISTRRLIWESVRSMARLFIDGRMSAEVMRVLAAESPSLDRHYATTLFDGREAHTGSCTGRSTIYTAAIAAGLMVGQMTRWLRGLPVEADMTLNLLASEMTIIGSSKVAS
jgi:sulfur carrier protein ThiS adenylyltransferase